METILQNPQLNSAEFYAVTELIPQPQPSSPQLQLPPPQQLPYNNIDLNNPVSSYNNLESQNPFDIYTSYTQILSENDSFFHGQQTSFDQKNHPSSPFTPPSQLPQTQTSNRDKHSIAKEDPIIRFHDENMDDFTEDEDQQFFDHINHQSDDQSDDQTNDEGVGRPTTPPSPPLQYQQPRCPVDLNFDHLPHYIDRHHFVHQQHNVQPPVGILEVGMTFDDKAQYIRAIKEYNIKNHFDCRTIYSDQRMLNFVCKLHENGCTWSLGACNSKRHNKWIIKSIRSHHTCLVPMFRQDHRQLDKHVIAQIIQPIVKTNPTVSIKTLIAEIKTFMNYTSSYKKTWLAKQRVLEMMEIGKNHMSNCQNFSELCNLVFPGLWSLLKQSYAYTEKMHWRHLGDIRANKPSAAEWLDQLPKQKWVQCFDERKFWGHMNTNLSKSINSMFKNTRHLPVSSLVEETYFKTAQLFANRGRQTHTMINFGSQYSEVVFDAMNSGQQESNSHIINEFDRHNHTFIITETQSPLESPRPPERFRVMLQSQKCDCGEYQAKHLSCSHVMVACKSVNVDLMTYVPMLFTLQHILHIYDNSFGLLPHESMWQEYEGDQWRPGPRRKRTARGRPVLTRIPIEMDEDENERASRKKCGLCR
ncbi:hypothetical protein GmHk_11G032949 [Glycine max]|nr:hypothetical protein GmHk_11G032949 [Glycine max]